MSFCKVFLIIQIILYCSFISIFLYINHHVISSKKLKFIATFMMLILNCMFIDYAKTMIKIGC